MKSSLRRPLQLALSALFLAGSLFALSACSSHDVAKRQQGISDAHQDMLDRRAARQEARDERFRASREAVLN